MFRLHEWFLDCVTPAGEVLVVYAATLRWGVLRLGYAATLWHADGLTVERTRLGHPPRPQTQQDGFALDAPGLRLRGNWRGPAHPTPRALWRSPRGGVSWHCHLPDADVEIELDGRAFRGRGYVEHLTLEVAPWHLPINELRWGRWHGGGHSLVWIQWKGPQPLRLCLLDGEPVTCDPIGDDGFVLADGRRLRLASQTVLRDGPLGRTVLAQRFLRLLPLPRGVRDLCETKWLAQGSFTDANRTEGMALHEVVRWA